MKKQSFKNIIQSFVSQPLKASKERTLSLPENIDKVVSVIGARRSGKTFVLFELIKKLRKKIPHDRIVYINFEDDRLFPLGLENLGDFIDAYFELYPKNRDELVYFLFDEVQEIENWEKFIRRIYDTENCRIYITGSSSKLLSSELATALRGRSLPFYCYPLSFKEFLSFKNVKYNLDTSRGKSTLKNELTQFVKQGGYPELVFNDELVHKRIINEYLDLMIFKDLTERYSIRQPQLIKYLLKYLINNLSTSLSINKVYNDLKSQGYKIAKNTIYDYVAYLEDIFTVFRVDKYSTSIRKQAINPSKIYTLDSALKYAMTITEDFGRVLENIVFIELKRREKEIFYYLNKQEVDFYLPNEKQLINVCYDLSDFQTRQREYKSLHLAMHDLNLNEATLLTWDENETVDFEGKKIHLTPLINWLLTK